jgi:small subunit ribosomal protein S16
VTRFLDAAGIMKREKRNNPQKAVPRKERKAKEEAAKAAPAVAPAAAPAAAPTGAAPPAA